MTDKVKLYTITYSCDCWFVFRNMNDFQPDIQVVDHYLCKEHSIKVKDNLGVT